MDGGRGTGPGVTPDGDAPAGEAAAEAAGTRPAGAAEPWATDPSRLLEHPEIARIARLLAAHPVRTEETDEPIRRAAIALVLRPHEEHGLELLMILRAEHPGDPWSGHVACPGGRQEPGDHDLAQTAARETWEETGVDIARQGIVLGALDEVRPRTVKLPRLIIRPYVAAVVPDVTLTESAEVAESFWVPLPALLHEPSWVEGMVHVRAGEERLVPTFRHARYTVWGLTERVLRGFVEMLRNG